MNASRAGARGRGTAAARRGGSSPAGRPVGVLLGLQLDAAQRVARGLGLEDADGLAVDEEQVVGEAVARASSLNSRTATPRPAERFISSRSWTTQPAATSAASICSRAFCSGAPEEGLNASSCWTGGALYRGATVMGFNRKCRAAADMWRSFV